MTIPDVPDPNADLADIRQKWLAFCAIHDDLYVGDLPCICPTEDHRPVIAALVTEVETLRAEVARLEGERNEAWAMANINRDTFEGCCRAAVESDGHAHDHIEWYCDLIEAEAERDQLRIDVDQLTADRDSLIKAGWVLEAERAEARDVVTAVKAQRNQAEALLRMAPHHQQQVATLEYELVQARAEVVRLAAEYDRGRRDAAEAIAAHRDKFWPNDGLLTSVRARVRRHLNIAIQVANPPTLADAAAALKAACRAGATLIAAVDQMAPSTPPSTPQSDGQVEVAVTDAVEAPGGTEGGPIPPGGIYIVGEAARDDAAANAVEVHTPVNDDGALYCGWSTGAKVIDGCGYPWPCPTVLGRGADPEARR